MICASCRVDAFHGTGGDPKIGGKKRSFQPRCRSFFAPRSFRRMSQASQPCAGVISKMGGKWGMSFGEHFKFSISSVHCKVFWRVSNYLFNIGSFLISPSPPWRTKNSPGKYTAKAFSPFNPLQNPLFLVRSFVRQADACDARELSLGPGLPRVGMQDSPDFDDCLRRCCQVANQDSGPR